MIKTYLLYVLGIWIQKSISVHFSNNERNDLHLKSNITLNFRLDDKWSQLDFYFIFFRFKRIYQSKI